MSTNKAITLVIGLSACGKTTLARKLAAKTGATLIRIDAHRYEPDGKWIKRSATAFIADVLAAVDAAPDAVIAETTYIDMNDAESARVQLVEMLMERGARLVVFTPITLDAQLEAQIARALGRAAGTEEAGSCPETAKSVLAMIRKSAEQYHEACTALTELAAYAASGNPQTLTGTRDELTAALNLPVGVLY